MDTPLNEATHLHITIYVEFINITTCNNGIREPFLVVKNKYRKGMRIELKGVEIVIPFNFSDKATSGNCTLEAFVEIDKKYVVNDTSNIYLEFRDMFRLYKIPLETLANHLKLTAKGV